MATASETVTAAFREGNLIAAGASPTTAEQTEGLALLNGILAATPGFEAGQELADLTVGGTYDQSSYINDYVPENARLVMASAGSRTFRLHPQPYDGQRVAMVDAAGTLSANPLTLDANGRRIEGLATLMLNTDSESREWIYRADLGEWKRLTPLTDSDSLPFPVEFDRYFALLLLMQLGGRHGVSLTQQQAAWMDSLASRMEARYRRPRPVQDWGSLGLLHQRDRFRGDALLYGRVQ